MTPLRTPDAATTANATMAPAERMTPCFSIFPTPIRDDVIDLSRAYNMEMDSSGRITNTSRYENTGEENDCGNTLPVAPEPDDDPSATTTTYMLSAITCIII